MGFFDYLLFGALINSLRNSGRSNNTHSSFSSDGYNRGYEDGYNDSCMDHEIMNVSPQYVSEVVNERKNITITVLAKFAKALQVPMASLVEGYHEKEQLGFNSFNCPYCGNVISIEKSDKC